MERMPKNSFCQWFKDVFFVAVFSFCVRYITYKIFEKPFTLGDIVNNELAILGMIINFYTFHNLHDTNKLVINKKHRDILYVFTSIMVVVAIVLATRIFLNEKQPKRSIIIFIVCGSLFLNFYLVVLAVRINDFLDKIKKDRDLLPINYDGFYPNENGRYILVIGDINRDDVFFNDENTTDTSRTGGCAFNAAQGFAKYYSPVLFGGIGRDSDGVFIKNKIEDGKIIAMVLSSKSLTTGKCVISLSKNRTDMQRYYLPNSNSCDVNDFNVNELKKALTKCSIEGNATKWYIYFVGYVFLRYKKQHLKDDNKGEATEDFIKNIMNALCGTGAPVIFRVPKESYDILNLDDFNLTIGNVSLIITEFRTLMAIIGKSKYKKSVTVADIDEARSTISEKLIKRDGQYLLIRYGDKESDMKNQTLLQRKGETFDFVEGFKDNDTGYSSLDRLIDRIGFTDRAFAELFWQHDKNNKNHDKEWTFDFTKFEVKN